jgi:hypothetical protein
MGAIRYHIPRNECIERLAAESVGRLCFIDHGYPLAFPVNYRLVDPRNADRIVFRTSATALLARYEGPSSLEVDQISPHSHAAWSVVVRGRLRHARGEPDLPDTEPLAGGERSLWLILDVEAITGRRFVGVTTEGPIHVAWRPPDD